MIKYLIIRSGKRPAPVAVSEECMSGSGFLTAAEIAVPPSGSDLTRLDEELSDGGVVRRNEGMMLWKSTGSGERDRRCNQQELQLQLHGRQSTACLWMASCLSYTRRSLPRARRRWQGGEGDCNSRIDPGRMYLPEGKISERKRKWRERRWPSKPTS